MLLRQCRVPATMKTSVFGTFKTLQKSPQLSVSRHGTSPGDIRRPFSITPRRHAVQPYLLADIGEGITECQVVSWAVKEGDLVQQFSPICEVQSDKASVEITSRFDGVVKKLYYGEGDLAKVGFPLMDIDVTTGEGSAVEGSPPIRISSQDTPNQEQLHLPVGPISSPSASLRSQGIEPLDVGMSSSDPATLANSWTSLLATPAVRHLLHEHGLDIAKVQGTGKDGRVLKQDVLRHIESHGVKVPTPSSTQTQAKSQSTSIMNAAQSTVGDQKMALSPVQRAMFQAMTASLSIPHFLYTHHVDFTCLTCLVRNCRTDQKLASRLKDHTGTPVKLTLLSFVLKALSQAIRKFPIVNSAVDTVIAGDNPAEVLLRGSHNIGIAVDSPHGLLVPVVRDVQNHSILSLAMEVSRLATLAKTGKLTPADMSGASIVVSNIGSIGGSVVGPVILSPMTAIVAVGQTEAVAAFEMDRDGAERIVKKEKAILSWSADHRILDGATIARCAQEMAVWLEQPELFALETN